MAATFVAYCLLPQDLLQVFGPGLLHLLVSRLKHVSVLRFPLSEPNLKTQAAVPTVLGYTNV